LKELSMRGFYPLLLAATACSPALVGLTSPCEAEGPLAHLPREIHESSGVVASPTHPGVFWTHNDSGGHPQLFAVDGEGALLGRVAVPGARNRDWEDLAVGPCDDGHCLYIGDVGDNREARTDPAIYRVPEPAPDDHSTAPADRFPVRFPHGPRDVEAIYLLPGERLFLVTKGRNHRVEVYRVPAPLDRPGEPLELERIQRLTRISPALPRHVTGGASTPDGKLVAIRTYETLALYRPDADGRLDEISGTRVNLRHLREPQGEAVAFLPGNRIVLTSEAGLFGDIPTMAFLTCPGMPVGW
jgi:hypothetical protein